MRNAGGAALAALAFFGVPLAARADAPAPLDAGGAVQYALAHDPTVLARRATLAQYEATYAKNHAAEFPTLAGQLQNQLAKGNGANGGQFQQYGLTQAQLFSQNTAQIASTWTLYNGSLSQIQAQEAVRQIEASRSDVRRAEQQLAADVGSAWYGAVQQRDAVRLAASDLAYQQQLLAAARAQERVGRIAGVDVLRAQVNALRSEAALATQRAAEANAREALAQRIGAPPETAFALPEELPEPQPPATPLGTLVALALAGRADVASAQAQVAAARLTDAAIETDRRPQLSLSGAFGNQEVPATTQLAGFPAFSPSRTGFWQIAAQETLTVPFIEYGARRAQHRAARAQLASAEAALASSRSGVEVDVRQALRGVETSRANLGTQREADRLGRESARIAQMQYRNGLISLTDATAAEQSALSAANDLVAARVAYLTALVRLRSAVGTADPLTVIDVARAFP
ncbi:MAG: TolC family protein [Candidatus Eremiobacteraeota bacterium]|nr:TolC family protein [Candidatus Eremiobacteraeota bacterium]